MVVPVALSVGLEPGVVVVESGAVLEDAALDEEAGSLLVAPAEGALSDMPLPVVPGVDVAADPLVAVSPPAPALSGSPRSHAAKLSDVKSAASNAVYFMLISSQKTSL